jgi:hypothetical protein
MGLKVLPSSRERKALEIECDDRAHGKEVPITRFDCGSLSSNVALAMAAGWKGSTVANGCARSALARRASLRSCRARVWSQLLWWRHRAVPSE